MESLCRGYCVKTQSNKIKKEQIANTETDVYTVKLYTAAKVHLISGINMGSFLKKLSLQKKCKNELKPEDSLIIRETND